MEKLKKMFALTLPPLKKSKFAGVCRLPDNSIRYLPYAFAEKIQSPYGQVLRTE